MAGGRAGGDGGRAGGGEMAVSICMYQLPSTSCDAHIVSGWRQGALNQPPGLLISSDA